MTHKHTAGPWNLVQSAFQNTNGGHIYYVNSADGSIRICSVDGYDESFFSTKANHANARLIAAAPDMLSELIKQRDWLKHIRPQITMPESIAMGFDQSEKYLTAIINKATGE